MIENSKSLLSLAFTSRLPFLSADVVHPSGSSNLKSGLPEGYSTVSAWVERAANPRAAKEKRRRRVFIAAPYLDSAGGASTYRLMATPTRAGEDKAVTWVDRALRRSILLARAIGAIFPIERRSARSTSLPSRP